MPLSSNATTASHGLYKLEIVVIADSRMLALYLYFLINHIQFSSVTVMGHAPIQGVQQHYD